MLTLSGIGLFVGSLVTTVYGTAIGSRLKYHQSISFPNLLMFGIGVATLVTSLVE